MRICIVQPTLNTTTETFIRAHAERLPGHVTVVHTGGGLLPMIADRTVLSQGILNRTTRKVQRLLLGRDWHWEVTSGYLKAFRTADVVLAEYGTTAVAVANACQIADVPLIAHFHGFDASKHEVLEVYRSGYEKLFRDCAAIVAVSTAMQQKLVSLGAPVEKVHLNVYGIDCEEFDGNEVAAKPPIFLSVGRFVEKKAPYLTLLAFAEAYRLEPTMRLRMIGDGPLLSLCRDLAQGLGIASAVTFLGAQPHKVVAEEMRNVRGFVQHSIEASDGDCEGTPLAVLEAGASGLPVVSTRHAGIPDVVVHGETGLLVDEKDVSGMAVHLLQVARDPQLAARMGEAGRKRVLSKYTMDHSIGRLWSIIESCVESAGIPVRVTPKAQRDEFTNTKG